MSNSDIFLELYKNLEETLTARYSKTGKYGGSVIMKYSTDDDGKKWREELNAFREMRNMLSHHATLGGEPMFEPSDSVIDVMRGILYEAQHPPIAMSIAMPRKRLTVCALTDPATEVMAVMETRGYSHVPVLDGDALWGIFSVGSVFSYFRKYGGDAFSSNMSVGDFAEFLLPRNHSTERFGFVTPDAPYSRLKEKFSAVGPAEPRTAALFVTDSGKPTGVLMGMITPWDMIKYFSE